MKSEKYLELIHDEFFDKLGRPASNDAFTRLPQEDRLDLVDRLDDLLTEAIDCAYIIGQREGLVIAKQKMAFLAESIGADGLPLPEETKH